MTVLSGAVPGRPDRCTRSPDFRLRLRIGEGDPCGDLTACLGVEAVSGEERVRPVPPPARIGDPLEGARVAVEQSTGGRHVRVGGLALLARPARLEQLIDQLPVHPLLEHLLSERTLAARSGPVTRPDPRFPERPVVEHPQLDQTLDGAVDQLASVAGRRQPPPHLGHGPGASLEKPGRGLEDDLGIVDGAATLAGLGV